MTGGVHALMAFLTSFPCMLESASLGAKETIGIMLSEISFAVGLTELVCSRKRSAVACFFHKGLKWTVGGQRTSLSLPFRASLLHLTWPSLALSGRLPLLTQDAKVLRQQRLTLQLRWPTWIQQAFASSRASPSPAGRRDHGHVGSCSGQNLEEHCPSRCGP